MVVNVFDLGILGDIDMQGSKFIIVCVIWIKVFKDGLNDELVDIINIIYEEFIKELE